jgi:hypothetical protein
MLGRVRAGPQLWLPVSVHSVPAARDVEMTVTPVDYLRLLEGGNFIHFVAMVIADNETSAVDTLNLRLKVW